MFFILRLFIFLALIVNWASTQRVQNGTRKNVAPKSPACSKEETLPVALIKSKAKVRYFETLKHKNFDSKCTNYLKHYQTSLELKTDCTITLWGLNLEEKYTFDSAVFKWPAEHTINGNHYDLELQINSIRKKNQLENVKGKWLKLSVLYNIGDFVHPAINAVVNDLDVIKNSSETDFAMTTDIALSDFFPDIKSHYKYSVCSDFRIWIVFDQIPTVTTDQVDRFRQLELNGHPIISNNDKVRQYDHRELTYCSSTIPKIRNIENVYFLIICCTVFQYILIYYLLLMQKLK